VVIHKVVDLGVHGPSQFQERLDGNERGWGGAFVVAGALEMALEPSVEGVVMPSNLEGGNWPMGC